jgi:hypothetical protein
MLTLVACDLRIPARSQAVLERLGLVQKDLFTAAVSLTADGREHCRRADREEAED